VEVRFNTPQRAAAPGQSVVFYQGDLVVGGGVIAPARPEAP
jgi:tRNA-specific 2-thiouridylase